MGWLFNEDRLVSQPLSHIAAYSANKKTKTIAICDIDKDKLSCASKRYGIKKCYTDYRKMLKNEKVDIVSVCTPTVLHSEICVAAARSGVRAIFCEKPIAASLKEAEDMIAVCDKHNVTLIINHSKRWDSAFEWGKGIIRKKAIGEVCLINAFATVGLFNSGTHMFDLLRYYFGDVESVSGSIIPDKSTDPGARGTIRFRNGLLCFFDSCWREYVFFGMDIYGEKGMLKYNGSIRSRKAFDLFLTKKSGKETGINELRHTDYKAPRWTSPILMAVTNIVNHLEKGEEVMCSGRDGKAALEIALAFHESKGREIMLPLKNKSRRGMPRQTSFTRNGRLK